MTLGKLGGGRKKRREKRENLPPTVIDQKKLEEGADDAGFWENSLVNLRKMCEGCELAELGEDCPPECLVLQKEEEDDED